MIGARKKDNGGIGFNGLEVGIHSCPNPFPAKIISLIEVVD